MDEIKDVMISNIDKLLQRGEKLELIIDKSNNLAETATVGSLLYIHISSFEETLHVSSDAHY